MSYYGTNCFIHRKAVNTYYSSYYYDKLEIEHMLSTGVIRIGRPLVIPEGSKLLIDQSEGRYMIEIKD